MKTEPSEGAVRASKKICFGVFLSFDDIEITQLAKIIDKETGLKEMVEALELHMKWVGRPPVDKYTYDSLREDAWKKGIKALAKTKGDSSVGTASITIGQAGEKAKGD